MYENTIFLTRFHPQELIAIEQFMRNCEHDLAVCVCCGAKLRMGELHRELCQYRMGISALTRAVAKASIIRGEA